MTDLPAPAGSPAPAGPPGAPVPEAVRVRLDLGYDGTGFAGWARQPGLRTVQGVLEDALATVLPREAGVPRAVQVTVAGRTDAGVHARGQVAHLDLPAAVWGATSDRAGRDPGTVLADRLAGVLPDDVVVHRAAAAPPGFDARFAALSRRYAYRVCDDPALRDPLRRDHVLWHRGTLDVAAMAEAATALLGRHDFAAFCRPRPEATTIRTLQRFAWVRETAGPDAGLVVAHVEADAFCHSMVRALVGASLAVGEGRRDAGWPARLLAAGERESQVAPALGLTLEQVGYPPDAELAARAGATRARRLADDVDGLSPAPPSPALPSPPLPSPTPSPPVPSPPRPGAP